MSSDTASDRGESPHASENSSRYSSRSSQPLHPVSNVSNSMHYPSPTQMQQPLPMLQNDYVANNLMENAYIADEPREQEMPMTAFTGQKAFACNTCGKGFARRSDLARHGEHQELPVVGFLLMFCAERIHSGIRPHVCDYPGCNKQFIQRSALTVHARVHTGEKPHMCERCGKVSVDSTEYVFLYEHTDVVPLAVQRLQFLGTASSNPLWKTTIQVSVCGLSEDLHASDYPHTPPESPYGYSGRSSSSDSSSSGIPIFR
jgi:uncharacterized C2H2 Zn-finger protein